ncbi:DMT family transporter [Williamsia muralis]|uniref:DMT family transporter n=1 Tax=Williamsia marianensis TaxID=85044 RepID=UPI001CB95DB7|nr:DMT family transporter [Williamsia marianensis]
MFLIGVLFASAAAVAYGLSTVLRALGARKAAVAAREHDREHQLTTEGGPSVSSTVDTFKTREFILGTSLVVIGFGAGAVAARFLPLFLSQTIVSANLIVTALVGTAVLGIRLHGRDWVAMCVVVASLCALGLSSSHEGGGGEQRSFHYGLLFATCVLAGLALLAVYKLGKRGAIVGGAAAGLLFGVIAISVRILRGIDPFDIVTLLTDPAAWTIAIAGAVGFYVHTVALQLGQVNGVTAVLVVGETAGPGIIGVVFLNDSAKPGLGWLAVIGFIGAVVGAVLVALYSSVDADHFGESDTDNGGWRLRKRGNADSLGTGDDFGKGDSHTPPMTSPTDGPDQGNVPNEPNRPERTDRSHSQRSRRTT